MNYCQPDCLGVYLLHKGEVGTCSSTNSTITANGGYCTAGVADSRQVTGSLSSSKFELSVKYKHEIAVAKRL